jgi:acetyl-CoA C-acetyltransferase
MSRINDSGNIGVMGTGQTKFGELWEESIETLAKQSIDESLKEAGLDISEIDLLVVGNKLVQQLEGRAHVGALIADEVGYEGPTIHVEGACASGGLAVRQGLLAIKAKTAKRVLVVGVEKMTDVSVGEIGRALMSAASEEEYWAGATFPSIYGMMARAYLEKYNLDEDVLAWPSVKNHDHGIMNPLAQYQKKIGFEKVNKSALVADPLRQLHCSPVSDGAAAVILSGVDKCEVEIIGSGHAGDSLGLHGRKKIWTMKATKTAFKKALNESGMSIEKIGLVELHDCFSITELLALEDMGFCKKGKAATMIKNARKDGYWKIEVEGNRGGLVVNSSGGLKACGHPVGATGVKQVVEVARQIGQKVDKTRRIKELEVGATHNVGGSGATVLVHVLKKSRN